MFSSNGEHLILLSRFALFYCIRPVLWRVSSRPELGEAYHSHSHLQVHDHTTSLAHHLHSKSSSSIHLNDSFYHVNNHSSSLSSESGGKSRRPSSIELDHPYACSSNHIHRALRTLIEPRPPSPSSSPPPPPLSSTPPMSTAQQIMLISTPPTPPPTSSTDLSSQEQEQQATGVYTKSSSTYVLSPSTSFFPGHHHSYVIPSGTPASLAGPPSKSSSCALVQFVQLHRMLPSTKTHSFASSTPVTTFDSWVSSLIRKENKRQINSIEHGESLGREDALVVCIVFLLVFSCPTILVLFLWLVVVSFTSSQLSVLAPWSSTSSSSSSFYICLFVCMCVIIIACSSFRIEKEKHSVLFRTTK